MFATKTFNLQGYVGQPFSRTFKLTSAGVAYDLTGKEVKFVVKDANAQASVSVIVDATKGFIELTTNSLSAQSSHAEWYMTIGSEGVLLKGTFEFEKL